MLYILTPLFCAGLCLGTVFSFLNKGNTVTASAEAVTINELTLNGSGAATNGFVFNQDNLNTLYNKILNQQSGATLADIKSKISGTATYAGAGTVNKMINSNEINGGAVLKVKFGGLEWQVTSVTTSNNADSDVIATLWLTDNNSSIETNAYSYGNYYTDSNQTYQTNVYGTSHMRVVTLNAGGQYVIANSSKQGALSTRQLQSSSNKFAKFTMPSIANSLTKYIVQPKDVAYQSQESWAGSGDTNVPYCCPNDAYGTPYVATWRAGLEVIVDKTDYTAWENDYLWLPSLTETGAQGADSPQTKANGIWNMTAASRARAAAYLRSASNASIANVIYLTSEGKFRSNYPNVSAAAVRPALHLNLTKAQAASPTVVSTKPSAASSNLSYNGHEQTYTPDNFDSTTMEITDNKATTVGDYECTVTLKAGYAWNNTNYDTSEVTIPYKVEKGTPNVTLGYVDTNIDLNKLYLKDYGSLPAIQNVHENATAGNLNWNSGEVPVKDKQGGYKWTFTPADTANYNEVTGAEPLVFKEAQITGLQVTKNDGKDIYDKYNTAIYGSLEAYIKSCITVKIKYEDNTVSASPVADGDYSVTTNDISVTSGTSQNKTISVRVKNTAENTQLRGMTGSVTTEVNKAVINSMTVEEAAGFNALSYPFTLAEIKANYDVYLGWNFAPLELLADESKVTVALKDGGELEAGTLTFLFTYTDGALTKTSDPVDIEISKGTHDVSGITFTGGNPITYNGQSHSIAYSGTLPAGVGVQYTHDGTTQETPFSFTEAGDYEITLSFTQDDTDNYEVISKTIKATLKIIDAVITDISVEFTQGDTVYPSTSLDTLKDWITVTAYYNNGTDEEITDYGLSGTLEAGERTITVTYSEFSKTITVTVTAIELDYIEAEFTQGGAVYPSTGLDALKEWITVTAHNTDGSRVDNVTDYQLSGELTAGESQITVTYGGKEDTITVDVTAIELVRIEVEFTQGGEVYPTSALSVLKPWLTVTAYYNDENEEVVSDYELTGAFTAGTNEITVTYEGLKKTIEVEVTDVAIVGVDFSFTQNGVVYPSSSLDLLKDWLTVTATLNNGATDEIKNYSLLGEFTVGESQITVSYGEYSKTITVEVTATAVDYIEAQFTQGGVVYHTTELSVLKDWLTVTAHYTDGTSSVVTDYGLSGALTAGECEITVTYGAEHTDTVTVKVDKVKVALPVYKGGLSYTGENVKPAAADFEGFDSAIMSFVEDKLPEAINAGTYKAVFALTDTDRYEWATKSAVKKSVFAVVVYDGLEANEVEVNWTLAKAKVSATKANGKLPVFASESFGGSLADIVGLKYYTDETLAEEVAADELAYSTKYYVKAELLNNENFELDETAVAFVKTAFEYTTPEKQLTVWEKIVKFVTSTQLGLPVWAWIAIAVVALILLITIIACAARSAKRKRELEEQRRLEEKAERERKEERDREERRLEREERMARLNQAQAMPQMMMPQMMGQMQMPQSMPQSGQPVAAGGVASSNEIAELRAEMAAMKATQDMAKELALRAEMAARESAMRAEQNAVMRSDINAMRGDNGQVMAGMTAEMLAEIVSAAVEKVLDRREKPAAAATPENGAAAQVPPDAVMTTVTTTKIDTTKKTAQSAQSNAQAQPARPIVRNYVAPMPVDDGRVFDVGGFYTPADPVDLNFVEDEKKD